MEFFSYLGGSSNFMVQSGNSLLTVTRLQDYKVFLNPGLIVDKQAAAKRVVDAWSKQGWFENPQIVAKFKKYGSSKGFDFSTSSVEDFLRNNGDWFIDIFQTNILMK